MSFVFCDVYRRGEELLPKVKIVQCFAYADKFNVSWKYGFV